MQRQNDDFGSASTLKVYPQNVSEKKKVKAKDRHIHTTSPHPLQIVANTEIILWLSRRKKTFSSKKTTTIKLGGKILENNYWKFSKGIQQTGKYFSHNLLNLRLEQ